MTKTCTLCDETKTEDDFYRRSGANSHLLSSQCKDCCKAYRGNQCEGCGKAIRRSTKNCKDCSQFLHTKDKPCAHCGLSIKGQSAARKYCVLCAPSSKWSATIRLYGVSYPDFQKMYKAQKGLCTLCKVREAVAVDHNHTSGVVRDLLCKGCNIAVGFLDNEEWRERALKYIER